MGWRVVTIESACKLSYKNGYMLVRGETQTSVYIPDMDSLIVATTQCQITCVLLSELNKNKVNVIFCDEKHNPSCVVTPFYGCHNSSKKIAEQVAWNDMSKDLVFTEIIKRKILNQAKMLETVGKQKESLMLAEYASEVLLKDRTNREGFSAKVYFNAMFGMEFSRSANNAINAALDYGYTVLLSRFNREVVSCGYLTQLGIGHKNEFNQFNFSCDLIEPFRVIVDRYVYYNRSRPLDTEYKRELISLMTQKVFYEKEYYLTDAIGLYVRNVIDAIRSGDIKRLKIYEF